MQGQDLHCVDVLQLYLHLIVAPCTFNQALARDHSRIKLYSLIILNATLGVSACTANNTDVSETTGLSYLIYTKIVHKQQTEIAYILLCMCMCIYVVNLYDRSEGH